MRAAKSLAASTCRSGSRPVRVRGSRSFARVMRLDPETQASFVVDAHDGTSVVVMP
jgi:hypothetical protein